MEVRGLPNGDRHRPSASVNRTSDVRPGESGLVTLSTAPADGMAEPEPDEFTVRRHQRIG